MISVRVYRLLASRETKTGLWTNLGVGPAGFSGVLFSFENLLNLLLTSTAQR